MEEPQSILGICSNIPWQSVTRSAVFSICMWHGSLRSHGSVGRHKYCRYPTFRWDRLCVLSCSSRWRHCTRTCYHSCTAILYTPVARSPFIPCCHILTSWKKDDRDSPTNNVKPINTLPHIYTLFKIRTGSEQEKVKSSCPIFYRICTC